MGSGIICILETGCSLNKFYYNTFQLHFFAHAYTSTVMNKSHSQLTPHLNIKKGKIPKIHFTNGLKLDKVPEELELTDLEQQLIARSLLFMKVKKLPN